jgi:hypothetical protein
MCESPERTSTYLATYLVAELCNLCQPIVLISLSSFLSVFIRPRFIDSLCAQPPAAAAVVILLKPRILLLSVYSITAASSDSNRSQESRVQVIHIKTHILKAYWIPPRRHDTVPAHLGAWKGVRDTGLGMN